MRNLSMILCGLLIAQGASAVEKLNQVVDYDGAERVVVDIRAAAMKLDIRGDDGMQMEGDFEYSKPEFEPLIDYRLDGTQGVLSIVDPGFEDWDGRLDGGVRDDWDLHWQMEDREVEWEIELGDGPDLDLQIKVGAVEADIDLSDLRLRGLNVEIGAGDVDFDLRGVWQGNVEAEINVGVGDLEILLPEAIGLAVVIESGIGDIDIVGLDKVEGQEVETEGFRIPFVGVEIKPEKGGWFAEHFAKSGVWTNDHYGQVDQNLRLHVKMGVGEIEVLAQ